MNIVRYRLESGSVRQGYSSHVSMLVFFQKKDNKMEHPYKSNMNIVKKSESKVLENGMGKFIASVYKLSNVHRRLSSPPHHWSLGKHI